MQTAFGSAQTQRMRHRVIVGVLRRRSEARPGIRQLLDDTIRRGIFRPGPGSALPPQSSPTSPLRTISFTARLSYVLLSPTLAHTPIRSVAFGSNRGVPGEPPDDREDGGNNDAARHFLYRQAMPERAIKARRARLRATATHMTVRCGASAIMELVGHHHHLIPKSIICVFFPVKLQRLIIITTVGTVFSRVASRNRERGRSASEK